MREYGKTAILGGLFDLAANSSWFWCHCQRRFVDGRSGWQPASIATQRDAKFTLSKFLFPRIDIVRLVGNLPHVCGLWIVEEAGLDLA